MDVAIVGTGEELLLGTTENTHFGEIARRLRELGHRCVGGLVVGDGLEDVRDAIRSAAARADVVVVTGGLGPTRDDVTRDAAAAAAGVGVELREKEVRELEARFAALGRVMPPANAVQARFRRPAEPPRHGARVRRRGGGRVRLLPVGVPREMRVQLEQGVLPRLGGRETPTETTAVRTLRVFGLPEAELDRSLGRLMDRSRDPAIGLTADDGILTVTIRGGPETPPARMGEVEAAVRGLLGDLVYGRDDATLATAVAAELRRTGMRLAVAESCTGGLVTARLVSLPGISEHLEEAVVAYANAAKVRRLGVREETLETHGAVGPETAVEMAEGIRRAAGVDVGLSTTGIAGPGGGTPEKPVGLVLTGISVRGRTAWDRHVHFGDRDTIRDRAAKTALDVLRRALAREA
jgi:nicotinamide-nucleotide amidase